MGCKNCNSSGYSEEEHRKSFAATAMKLAMALPDEVTCRKNFAKPDADFLCALRDLASEYGLAQTWSESETRSRYESLKFADVAMTYAFSARMAGQGGGESRSCTKICEDEKDDCNAGCHNRHEGYFCYFDCRLTYFACLGRCITHGFLGGGISIG